jgi:ribosome biogenesis SPOUT family RNA methylase Rps3
VGAENCWFTCVKSPSDRKKLERYGKAFEQSVAMLHLRRLCLLDLNAPSTLAPKDAREFDYLVFGGILGDNPPRGRTKALRVALEKTSKESSLGIRDLGPKQMSTDTAVNVAKRIVDGTPFDKIAFLDTIQIQTGEGEEVELPYRYVADEEGKPILPPGLVEKLMADEEF